MKRWHKRLLVLLGIVVVIVVLRVTVFAPAPVPVTVYRVDRGRVEDTVVNSRAGTLESRLRAKMSPAIAGLVTRIPVEKGQWVTKDQMLLRLDDSEHQAQVSLAARSVDAARAASEEACLSADQAERERKRAEALAEQNLLSDTRLEEARTTAEVTRAACVAAGERTKQAQAALATAKATLAKTVMTAPFDGVVLDITTEVGEWISPSPPGVFIPPVMDLIDPDALYVSAPIDEADIARIEVGLPVRITMDAFRGMSFSATVSYVASYVETRQEQNRTLNIEAVFDEQELPQNLLPGISADVEVIMEARDEVVRIPTFALLEGGRVLVVNDEALVELGVETGIRNWAYTEIVGGLAEGDRVVVSLDRPEVKAGARVEVTEETGQ
jgi:HlyD family secretion protein